MQGTAESPGQPLTNMLKYIEETTASNVTNQDIASIHKLVTQVKLNREVGVNYMNSCVREQMIGKEGQHCQSCERPRVSETSAGRIPSIKGSSFNDLSFCYNSQPPHSRIHRLTSVCFPVDYDLYVSP